jgi:hypothetical protein
MWQRLSKPLEWLGRFGGRLQGRTKLTVGDPNGVDARGGTGWRRFLDAELLYDVWGPHPASPWTPYHTVPLFAALDRLATDSIGPAAPPRTADATDVRNALPGLARHAAPAPFFVAPESWTVLDVPGPACVEAAVWLTAAGCQPVCTFDNWPHPKGVLQAELVLAELLRWAPVMASLRSRLRPDSPPLWICDNQRFGHRVGTPGDFDNRYYLDDSILPGPALLRSHGIRRVVYVTLAAPPEQTPLLDLQSPFAELLTAGFPVEHVELASGSLEPRPFASSPGRRRIAKSTFFRSGAGGFGSDVPEPSSGGGG